MPACVSHQSNTDSDLYIYTEREREMCDGKVCRCSASASVAAVNVNVKTEINTTHLPALTSSPEFFKQNLTLTLITFTNRFASKKTCFFKLTATDANQCKGVEFVGLCCGFLFSMTSYSISCLNDDIRCCYQSPCYLSRQRH